MQSVAGDNSNLKHSIKREVITELLDPPGMTSRKYNANECGNTMYTNVEIQCIQILKYSVYDCGNTVFTNVEIQCIRMWKYSVYVPMWNYNVYKC